MKKLLKLAATVLLAAVPMLGAAQEKPKKELNPWIDCGIGAMLFEDVTWAAVSSNIIWDLGTTAVISDQSSQNTCNSKKAKTALYIGVTYANLSEETVKGDGKHLHAMLDIMSCEPAAHDSIIGSIRANFGQYLRDGTYAAKSSNAQAEDFYNIVQSTISAGYAQQCRI
jgi:hypothetical protein